MNYNTVRLRDAHAGAICLAVEFLQQYYVRTKRKELPVLKFLLYCTAPASGYTLWDYIVPTDHTHSRRPRPGREHRMSASSPPADDLYATLEISRDADAAAIKKAYLTLARQTHPDRNPGDETAKARFQAIGRAYATLSDPEKKSVYDSAGIVDDQGTAPGGVGWYDFWRDFYTRVTTEKLDKLAAAYRGSAEEEADLRTAYTSSKGSMAKILDNIMHCTADDELRFREKLESWIADGSLPRFAAFACESDAKKRRRQEKAAKEAKEAEELKKKLGIGDGPDALTNAIIARQQSRQNQQADFFSSLEAKYGAGGTGIKKGKKGSKKAGGPSSAMDEDPLDDAAFQEMQKKMLASSGKKPNRR